MKRKIIKLTEAQYKRIISEDFISPDSDSNNIENHGEVVATTPLGDNNDDRFKEPTSDDIADELCPGYLPYRRGANTYVTA